MTGRDTEVQVTGRDTEVQVTGRDTTVFGQFCNAWGHPSWSHDCKVFEQNKLRDRTDEDTATEAERLRAALQDIAARGFDCDNEDVRLWTREWVEHYRHLLQYGESGGV